MRVIAAGLPRSRNQVVLLGALAPPPEFTSPLESLRMTHAHSVLLVEDDDLCRKMVHRLIAGRHQVIDAALAREASDLIGAQRFDCALLDHGLPDRTGLDLLPEFGRARIPVVMLTNNEKASIATQAIKGGCDDYLEKSRLTGSRLREAIDAAVERQRQDDAREQQLRELYAFVATAAHDLQAPLRHVIRACGFARDDIRDGQLEEAIASMDIARSSASRLHSLVVSLLEYTTLRGNEVERQPVDLDAVLGTIHREHAATLAEVGAVLECTALPTVEGDGDLLLQLFANLIGNAIKFRSERPLRIRIEAERTDEHWRISVLDNGIGIAPEHRVQVFVPLERLHAMAKYDGHGMGLAICRRVVAKHGGEIWVESTEGEGSTFRFTLPT